ncbi:MAG: hypothetical protein SNI45_07915 [Rikenellaceae bacterium]
MRNLLLYLLLVLSTPLSAAWRPPVDNYSADTRVGGRQNWDIVQAKNGWIYFANNAGLLEYNGHDWSVRPLDYLSIVRSVECAEDGRIYIGGSGEIGYYAPDKMGRLSYTNLLGSLPEHLSSFSEVWDIHTNTNNVYFRLRRSIYILDAHGEFRSVESNGIILASCILNNSLYFATTNGFYVMGDSEPIEIRIPGQVPFNEIVAMSQFDTNRILIATTSHGLYLYRNGRVTPFVTTGDKLLCDNQIYSLAVSDQYIACGTVKGGVVTMDRTGEGAEQHSLKSGMSNNTVLSVMFDDSDNLWCGLDNGIDYLILSSPLRHSEVNRELRCSGYCTLLDSSYIYMGTNQGLICADYSSQLHTLQLSERQPEVIAGSEGQVWNIQKVGEEIYCCHTRGLFRVDRRGSRLSFTPIYTDDGVWNVVPIDQNSLLVGSYEGVVKLSREASGGYAAVPIGGYLGPVRDIVLLSHLNMGYFVSEHGLERLQFDASYSVAKNQRLIEDTSFNTKLVGIDNQIIIYTPQAIYNIADDGSLQQTHDYDAIFDLGSYYSMVSVDEQKNIWYVAGDQLLRRGYDAVRECYDDECQLILTDYRFFIHGFTRVDPLDSRHYVVNGAEGFSIVDSRWVTSPKRAAEPLIVGVYDTNNRDSLLLSSAYGVAVERVELPYSSNSIQIIFGGNRVEDSALEYSYKLKGSDSEWSQWRNGNDPSERGAFNQKEYTQLFEGRYTFLLRVKEPSGEITQSALDIVILPPLLRTPQMYLLYALILISLALYARRRLIRYYADRRRLVELQSERQIEQQKRRYESQAMVQENKIIKLKNEKLEGEVVSKSAELSNLLLSKLEKNDIITAVKDDLKKIKADALSKQHSQVVRRVTALEESLDEKLIDNIDWSTFEENFNVTNNNFVQKLCEHYSWMSVSERKLCIYIRMGLQTKEIAPLLNLSVRGVEMLRYRIRKRMELERNANLYEFFQRFA